MPIAPIKTATEVPPDEMNGSGSPVGGIEPVTTAIFKSVCTAITIPIPHASKQPKRSFALSPILNNSQTREKYATIKRQHPQNPNSSPIIEKMKSDSANGKKRYF